MPGSEASAVNQTDRALTSFHLQSSGEERYLKIIFHYNSDKYAEGKGFNARKTDKRKTQPSPGKSEKAFLKREQLRGLETR